MSQEQEYPLLSSASYLRPVTPRNNTNAQQASTPITPPDTIRHSASCESLKAASVSAASVSMTVTSDVSLTAEDIRSMSNQLSQARQNNEFPRTTSSPMDPQVTVEDFAFLMRLRELRGDRSTTPSESYMHLHVEIARRIKERDSILDENEVKREAARRVSNYLNTLEHEQFVYNAATSAPSTPGSIVRVSSSSHMDAETFTEEVLSIIEQVADQTLIDATEPLRHHEKVMKILDKCLREDSFDLKNRVQSLVGHDSVYTSLLEKHTASLKKIETEHQRQNMAFQLHDQSMRDHVNSLRDHDNSLKDHDNSLRNTSDILSDCGSFYSTQNATYNQRLMVHNQLLDNQHDMTSELLESQRAIIASLQTIMTSQGQFTNLSSQNLSTVSGIINQLSAITMALPTAVDQSVQRSVAQHFQPAMQRIMQAQQQAMLSLSEESNQLNIIDNDRIATTIAQQLLEADRANVVRSSRRLRISKAIRKLFCS